MDEAAEKELFETMPVHQAVAALARRSKKRIHRYDCCLAQMQLHVRIM